MSSLLEPFCSEEVLGLIRATGPPIPTPDDQTGWPTHTLERHPNADFISSCFLHLPLQDGERLRTLLNHILNSQWWRAGQLDDAPMAALDPFVHGTHGIYVCQFCETIHANSTLAVDCVRMHLDI
ncbi:hypothetical protein FRC14_005885 [Serendipita sp. 396]|nr:hypothetical protein FRC14_005885 [Serendipita sp. 396]KAG8782310.1 hypothetical protein FRC16_002641 [Serendipita sp. 398]KAG8847103.1 hypothetical protein FRC20_002822 [Serendipita sp. 405]KAG8851286.1 hypothetical protein FRB91_008107 [Serendipita sp. 411]